MSIKILHIISGLRQGGAESVLYHLLKNIDDRKQHVVVSLSMPDYFFGKIQMLNVNIYQMDFRDKFLGEALRLRDIIRSEKPDVIHTWMYHANIIGGVLGRMCGIKNTVWGVHHANPKSFNRLTMTYVVVLLNKIFSYWLPRNILYPGRTCAKLHEEFGFDKSKSIIVHNGFDIGNNGDSSGYSSDDRSVNGFRIIYVGRWNPIKDHRTLLEAANIVIEKYPNVNVAMYGDQIDSANNALIKLLSNYPKLVPHIKLHGVTDDINRAYRNSDLLVLSSLEESFSNVICEAMASGVPCVSTDVGEARNIIKDSGWIVPVGNPTLLAKAMLEFLHENEDSRHARSERAKQIIANHYSLSHMVSMYRSLWQVCLLREKAEPKMGGNSCDSY